MRHISFFLLVVLAAANGLPAAEQWLEFRGVDGKGHTDAKNLPLTWSSTTNVKWRAEVPGQGWSSPVIFQNKVYLTAAIPQGEAEDASDYKLFAIMLDAGTGELLKKTELFAHDEKAPKIHNKNSHASPTPLVAGDRIFVHFGHQGTACLDLKLNPVWKKVLNYPPVHGNGGTPILVNGKLIFSCDGRNNPFIVALDANSGEEVWRAARESDATRKFSFTTAQAIQVDGETQVISPGSNVVCSLNPDTGKEIWRVRYDGYSVVPRPVFAHGLVYVCTGFNTPSLLAIRPDGKGDVTDTHIEWQTKSGVPHTPSLIVDEENVYMVADNGVASCLDAKTGDQIWKKRLSGKFSASPLKAGNRIYFQDEEGKTTVIGTGRKFQVLGTSQLDERTLASFAAIDGSIFLRTDKALYRLAAE